MVRDEQGYLTATHVIRTPELVEFEFELAGLYSRFLAWLIDGAIAGAIAGAVLFGLSLLAVFASGLAGFLIFIALFLASWGYFTFFEWWMAGRTPGKKAMGLRVMQVSGVRVEFAQAALRNLLRAFDNLPFFYGVGGAVALLLHWKDPLHGFVRKMGDRDMSAIMRFVLIALVILPVLPKRNYGPYETLNPFETWLVVVLVVGMSLAGYVLYKFVPPQAGALIGGAVGGLISSTATTVSFARRTASEPAAAALAAQAIMVANTVSVLRVVLLVFLFAGVSAWDMWLPLAAVALTVA